MRRQDMQLLAQARQGDVRARCEVGRRYLQGADSFPRHLPSGLEHLRQAGLSDPDAAAAVLTDCLALQELVELGQLPALERAAANGRPAAQAMLGAWRVLQHAGQAEGQRWLEAAAAAGRDEAARALDAITGVEPSQLPLALLRAMDGTGLNARAVAQLAIDQAQAGGHLPALAACLQAALVLEGELSAGLARRIVTAVQLAQSSGGALQGLDANALRDALELCATQGDREVAFIVGRALCGIAVPGLPADLFGEQQNMRKGTAFLLRAADAGNNEAWLHLYRLHADHRLSVANPSMARFFLEKAALAGQAQAQRTLGALQLRTATGIAESEQAIAWLYGAAGQGDSHAKVLLSSLVLPMAGSDDEAAWAIGQVRDSDPWLAARLALSRAFGLSKLEALSVDPVDGLRPWGLVVGRNPFIVQVRLSAPRAIPALNEAALEVAQRAAALFAQLRGGATEGDLRNRSLRQRRLFERLGLDEALFFADVSSMTLETLRSGAKWAHRARQPLSDALAA